MSHLEIAGGETAEPGAWGSVEAASLERAGQPLSERRPAAHPHAKRVLDVTVAVALILICLPLLLAIALAILLDGGWPVLYRQERVGGRRSGRRGRAEWRERRFQILKFRTMVPGADSSPLHEEFIRLFVAGDLAPQERDRAGFKLCDDPRVTRVGRFLRATSLDELPQLFNVLGGTMSLVGPRPVPPYEAALYESWHRERLAGLPGITGPWQVEGRGRVSFEEMAKLDIDYVRHRTLRRDMSLLLRTVPVVFKKRGAR
jgi:lipopolysaccharide/colanic/teichoic acid biosynthesis glycosyltransferase